MSNEITLRQQAAQKLHDAAQNLQNYPCLVGFDGFVDYIIRIVDKKISADNITTIPTISALADRLKRAAGKSSNLELRVQQIKLGGNGPIMANALCRFDLPVTYFGPLGEPEVHPAFADFANRATVHSVSEPAITDALEFEDGKIMMGKHQSLYHVNYENIVGTIGEKKFNEVWSGSRFVGLVNWTMLDAMTDIWEKLLANNCPKMEPSSDRVIFFDLADPEKRSGEDIKKALYTLAKFSDFYKVILGVNEKESDQIAEVLELPLEDNTVENLKKRAADIQAKLGVNTVVIHPVKFAVAATAESTASVTGPYVEKPLISTGAGDHFNAGFSLARLLGLDIETALLTGVSTSGFYVRKAQSPSVPDLVNFLQEWK